MKRGFRRYWIYALLAHSTKDDQRKACYIGQTANLERRMREHLKPPRPGRGSAALFEWVAVEMAEVRVAILVRTDCDQSQATILEGYWLGLAVEAGFSVPGVHNWGRLPKPNHLEGLPTQWPVAEIMAASLPLDEVARSWRGNDAPLVPIHGQSALALL